MKTLLTEKCISCHGPLDQQAGLRLDAGELIHRGGDSGQVLTLGEPDSSLLLGRVRHADPDQRMPPIDEGTPLSAEEVELLSGWIAAGAPYPADETFLDKPEDHWAFQPLQRPEIPAIGSTDLSVSDSGHTATGSNPIDAFLQANRAAAGVHAAGRADDETILRRLTFGLTGLPPTPAQRTEFLNPGRDAAESARATARFVDALLSDPAHAERWARHWMDVWRYSDWDGYKEELRGSQRHIWHWRDWIIQSLAEDKPYDQMVIEMLAADEAAPLDEDALRGTGFLARNFHRSNRDIWLDATVEHTAKAFIGLTIDCAKCHDHKYDPIAQEEYYQFRAIFEPHQTRTDILSGQPDRMVNGLPRAYDADLDAKTAFLIAGDEKQPDPSRDIQPLPPRIVGLPLQIEPVDLPLSAHIPHLKAETRLTLIAVEDEQVAAAEASLHAAQSAGDESAIQIARLKLEVARASRASYVARYDADAAKHHNDEAAYQQLATEAARLQRQHALMQNDLEVAEKRIALEVATASDDSDDDATQKRIAEATEALAKAEEQREAAAEALRESTAAYESIVEQFPAVSTGRRLALARWITDSQNPLTARVAVNHIWMRHFGRPLVENVFDFGLRSPRPRQQELLDYLAVELIQSGWRMKHLHRLIVTSEAYAMASHSAPAQQSHNLPIDPDNETYWRFEPLRLEGEAIRDSLLAVADRLERHLGGPDIDHTRGEEVHRRSLYFRHAYEKQMTMLTTFDAASPNECYRRDTSIIPQQALVLANSEISRQMSRSLAERLIEQITSSPVGPADNAGDANERFVTQAFQTVLGRAPFENERQACRQFLLTQAASDPESTADGDQVNGDKMMLARASLIHVLINHNDFVTVR